MTAIPQKALALLENLKKLEMQENRIASISEGDFAGTLPLPLTYFVFTTFCNNFIDNSSRSELLERL